MIHPLVPGADPGGRQPIGLGVRVPMIVVSPWTAGGWVCSETFDHTSVLRFLEARFGVHEPNISAWRRSICGDLTSAFDFAGTQTSRRAALQRAAAPPGTRGADRACRPTDALPTQEPGVRPARALPYAWRVDPRVDDTHVWLDFANDGHAGAWFYVYDGTAPDDAPRRYSVAAGESLSDGWPLRAAAPAYDLTVHGANGYLANVRGVRGETLHVTLQPVAGERRLQLRLHNRDTAACTVQVRQRVCPSCTRATHAAPLAPDPHWTSTSAAARAGTTCP